ncbi:hypothetical protein Tsubulata_051395, partial [Turnera subulata]
MGVSSAIIAREDIRGQFKYRHKHGKESFVSRSDKHHVIKEGVVIRFAVKSWDEELLHFFGSLKPVHTGSVSWLDKYLVEATTNRFQLNLVTKFWERPFLNFESSISNDFVAMLRRGQVTKKQKDKSMLVQVLFYMFDFRVEHPDVIYLFGKFNLCDLNL